MSQTVHDRTVLADVITTVQANEQKIINMHCREHSGTRSLDAFHRRLPCHCERSEAISCCYALTSRDCFVPPFRRKQSLRLSGGASMDAPVLPAMTSGAPPPVGPSVAARALRA